MHETKRVCKFESPFHDYLIQDDDTHCFYYVNHFSNDKIADFSRLKKFKDTVFKFAKTGSRKFSSLVENSVRKAEIVLPTGKNTGSF